MRGKAKAYGCGYIFRFDLSLLASGIFFLSVFSSFLEKIKSRNIGEYSNGKKAVPKTVGSTPLKRDM